VGFLSKLNRVRKKVTPGNSQFLGPKILRDPKKAAAIAAGAALAFTPAGPAALGALKSAGTATFGAIKSAGAGIYGAAKSGFGSLAGAVTGMPGASGDAAKGPGFWDKYGNTITQFGNTALSSYLNKPDSIGVAAGKTASANYDNRQKIHDTAAFHMRARQSEPGDPWGAGQGALEGRYKAAALDATRQAEYDTQQKLGQGQIELEAARQDKLYEGATVQERLGAPNPGFGGPSSSFGSASDAPPPAALDQAASTSIAAQAQHDVATMQARVEMHRIDTEASLRDREIRLQEEQQVSRLKILANQAETTHKDFVLALAREKMFIQNPIAFISMMSLPEKAANFRALPDSVKSRWINYLNKLDDDITWNFANVIKGNHKWTVPIPDTGDAELDIALEASTNALWTAIQEGRITIEDIRDAKLSDENLQILLEHQANLMKKERNFGRFLENIPLPL